jgi:tetratricopeptide (TPR) repeat protein
VGHEKVGDVLLAKGDLVEAQAAYQQSLEIIQRLAASDPLNAGWRRQLSVCLTKIAELYERQSDRAQALLFAQESLSIDERLAALDPTNATWQNDVKVSRALVERLRK